MAKVKTAKKSRKNIKTAKAQQIFSKITMPKNKKMQYIIVVLAVALVGTVLLAYLRAASPQISCSASGNGKNGYLYPFCRETAGAQLPISYNLSSLTGAVRHISPNGNDNNNGSANAPFKTLAKAISSSASNDTIVVQNGLYREGRISIPENKTLKIIAHPGHTPVFSGSVPVSGNWSNEGSLRYRSYTPRPVTNGSGIDFTAGQNLTGEKMGAHPDQVWIGNTQLRQVAQKSGVVDGTFWVDTVTKRLYMSANDASKSDIEVSGDKGRFIVINSPNTVLEGITITRFSNTAADYGVVTFHSSANRAGLRHVKITDAAMISVLYAGNSVASNAILKDNFAENVTIQDAGWMGFSAVFTDYLTLNQVKVNNMNLFSEFSTSPQSGGLKTSRTYYTKVTNSDFSGNKSHAIWFDQSNKDAEVVGNIITDNAGAGIFYEISDGLLFANNYVKSEGNNQAVRLAGSSGLKLVNNTIIGGREPVGVYVDSRSMPGCSDPSKPECYSSSGARLTWGGDRDTIRPLPKTLDFMPRLDLMINNIVAYPTSIGYCGGVTVTVCITDKNTDARAPIETVLHKADVARGIPQTRIDGNVYANGSGALYKTALGTHTTVADFTRVTASAPVLIGGLDANSKYGNSWVNTDGTPTAALTSAYSQAVALPNDITLNQYAQLQAGVKRYGVIPAQTTPVPDPAPPVENQAPQVTLAALQATYTQPIDITLSATATDTDGSIVKVEFFSGTTKLREVTGNGPYNFAWKNVPAGTHSLTARATDNKGASTASTVRVITVNRATTNTPPPDTQAPSTPANIARSIRFDWARFRYVVDLRWSAATDNSGAIASYQISRNGVTIGEATSTNFTDSAALNAGTEYTYTITAKDAAGNISRPGNTSLKANCFLIWCSID